MKKTPIGLAAAQVAGDFVINRSDDQEFLNQNQQGWDDLNELKDLLAQSLLGFVINIDSITSSPELRAMLGGKLVEFDKLLAVFYSDVDRFSKTIQELRAEHEHLSGRITSMEQINDFTRLSMAYQALQMELTSLLSPTMAGIVLLLHEAVPQAIAVQQSTAKTDPTVSEE